MINGQPLRLSSEHQYALDKMEHSSEHIFITGRAGTGKSTLLQLFAKTTQKKHVILAPTGIAALNVNGQTLHSFFGFPPKLLMRSDLTRHKNYKLFKYLETIIIDEISMVRADMMDIIDHFLRLNRSNNLPFGGLQMIFFGDLFQLPPVVATMIEKKYLMENYESPYFFSANVFNSVSDFEMIELTKVYRQEERGFINLLDNIRLNEVDEYDMEMLNERFTDFEEKNDIIITLSSRNSIVDEINRRELIKLDFPDFTYMAKIDGNFPPSTYPTELALRLKKNAQVMFIKNDPEKQFVNGSIGIVSDIEKEKIIVDILDQNEKIIQVNVPLLTWEIFKYVVKDKKISTEVIGTFSQFPLKLAWAITIHKSQGKTFNKIIIDIGRGAFEYGQTYVALSRCRTLEGIYLRRPITMKDIFVDQKVIDFYCYKKRYL